MPKPFRFFHLFTKSQQKGILALFALLIFVQVLYFIFTSIDFTSKREKSAEEKQWLALQSKIDELKAKKRGHKDTIYLFNPNYLNDYKGYVLGLSVKELDRLYAYRKTGSYINSAKDFQKVTHIHDTLLTKLSPYFKFGVKPDYTKTESLIKESRVYNKESKSEMALKVSDINTALEEDLVKVFGIGPFYAKEILRRRAMLGGFVSMD